MNACIVAYERLRVYGCLSMAACLVCYLCFTLHVGRKQNGRFSYFFKPLSGETARTYMHTCIHTNRHTCIPALTDPMSFSCATFSVPVALFANRNRHKTRGIVSKCTCVPWSTHALNVNSSYLCVRMSVRDTCHDGSDYRRIRHACTYSILGSCMCMYVCIHMHSMGTAATCASECL